MPKPTQWDAIDLSKSSIQIVFNRRSKVDSEKLAALTAGVFVQASSPDGAVLSLRDTFQKFDDLDEAATPQEIYQALGVITGAQLQAAFKAIAIRAIDEDPSQ